MPKSSIPNPLYDLLIRNVFGERLKKIRKKRNLTQEQLSKLAEINRYTLSRLENKNEPRLPSFSQLIRLCVALEVSADYLLGLVKYE